jgi:hypothetical protein
MNKHLALAILGLTLWLIGLWVPFPFGMLLTIPGGFLAGWNLTAFYLKS